jgi:hypothetical protein
MNINDCHKIQRYGYTSYWYIQPGCPQRVFLKEKIVDREDFVIIDSVDNHWEYEIINDLLNALGASSEYVVTANGALGFNSIWDYDNNQELYWCVDPANLGEVINKVKLEPEPWWDAQGYYQKQWISAKCRKWNLEDDIKLGEDIVEDLEIVKTVEIRGGDSLFWNRTKGAKPRVFSLVKLTYPAGLQELGFVTISEGRGQEQKIYKAFEYAVNSEMLAAYTSVNKKVNTPKGEVTFYVVRDNYSNELEDTNFFYWAVDPEGNVLGTDSRWIGDSEDINWRARITKEFCSEPILEPINV